MKLEYGIILFIFILTVMTTVGIILPTYQQNQELKKKIEQLQEEVTQLAQKKRSLSENIETLSNDPFYAEYLLRKQFFYARKGEIILK